MIRKQEQQFANETKGMPTTPQASHDTPKAYDSRRSAADEHCYRQKEIQAFGKIGLVFDEIKIIFVSRTHEGRSPPRSDEQLN